MMNTPWRTIKRLAPVLPVFVMAIMIAPACAQNIDMPTAQKLRDLGDMSRLRQIEDAIADHVSRDDIKGLEPLAADVKAKDGPFLEELTAAAAELEASLGTGKPMDGSMERIILAMGPCEHAGLIARGVLIRIADGSAKPVFRHGAAMIDGDDADTMFAENMTRCEFLREKKPLHKARRRLGNDCVMNPIPECRDDPDF